MSNCDRIVEADLEEAARDLAWATIVLAREARGTSVERSAQRLVEAVAHLGECLLRAVC